MSHEDALLGERIPSVAGADNAYDRIAETISSPKDGPVDAALLPRGDRMVIIPSTRGSTLSVLLLGLGLRLRKLVLTALLPPR